MESVKHPSALGNVTKEMRGERKRRKNARLDPSKKDDCEREDCLPCKTRGGREAYI